MMRRHAPHGMTLLEVIVALTIVGSALASGAAVLGFLTDQQARAGTQAVVSASAVRGTIRDWLSEARLATEGDAEFRGRPGGAPASGASTSATFMRRDGESDELTFVTSAPTPVSASGTIVHLYVASGDSVGGRGLMAELRPWRRAGGPVIVSLAPDAISMRVRYLPSVQAHGGWLDSWTTTSVLPAALELRLVYDGANAPADQRAARAMLAEPFTVALAGRQ